MPSSYPGGLDAFINPIDTDTLDDPPHHLQHTNVNDAVEAVQAELGINPRGAFATVRARLDNHLTRLDGQHGLLGIVTFTANGTFTKATYPGLLAVLIQMVGGGGAGGGAAATGAGDGSGGLGGGGGAFAQSLVLATDLDPTEAVTVGAGGTPGAAGANSGGDGGDSIFDTISGEVRADAGNGGTGGSTAAAPFVASTPTDNGGTVGSSVGQLRIPGGHGEHTLVLGSVSSTGCLSGAGGASMFSPKAGGSRGAGNGESGLLYGGGGSAGANTVSQAARQGGAGAPGLVLVYLFGAV